MTEKTLVERAEAAKAKIMAECVPSLCGESGADGVFLPNGEIEGVWARYWTDDMYTWEQAVDDMPDDDIMDGCATAILSSDEDDLIAAAKKVSNDTIKVAVLSVIRKSLYEADDNIRQCACDAVEFVYVDDHDVLEFLRGDADAADLCEADVTELERIAAKI